jgi:pyrophosphatase PpaX
MTAQPGGRRWAAILFDLDGTLADTASLILTCYRHTMRRHLGVERPDAEWICTMGTPLREQMQAFAASEAELEAMLRTYSQHQSELHDSCVSAFPGVEDVLQLLRSRGVPQGLVTSKRRAMTQRTLRSCGLESSFDVIVTPDDVEQPKPHPESVQLALARLGNPDPKDVLLVGDSVYDIRCGKAAGVATAAVLWGPLDADELIRAVPDYVLRNIDNLRSLVLPNLATS